MPPVSDWPADIQQSFHLARAAATELKHHSVGGEHLLLALVHPDSPGSARSVLESFGVDQARARQALIDSLGDPFEGPIHGQQVAPYVGLVFERANLWAHLMEDEGVSSQHVLLAMADAENIDPVFVKFALESRLDELRDRVMRSGEGEAADVSSAELEEGTETEREGLRLAPTPDGHDPRRRAPWGSRAFIDALGRPAIENGALRQYLVDRDGHPVLTHDGKPVHLRVDRDGQPVLDRNGKAVLTPVDVPPGSQLQGPE